MKPGVTTYLDGEQPLEALKVGLVSYLRIPDLPYCLKHSVLFIPWSHIFGPVLTMVLTCHAFFTF
jgi:hypothetical protein